MAKKPTAPWCFICFMPAHCLSNVSDGWLLAESSWKKSILPADPWTIPFQGFFARSECPLSHNGSRQGVAFLQCLPPLHIGTRQKYPDPKTWVPFGWLQSEALEAGRPPGIQPIFRNAPKGSSPVFCVDVFRPPQRFSLPRFSLSFPFLNLPGTEPHPQKDRPIPPIRALARNSRGAALASARLIPPRTVPQAKASAVAWGISGSWGRKRQKAKDSTSGSDKASLRRVPLPRRPTAQRKEDTIWRKAPKSRRHMKQIRRTWQVTSESEVR